MDHSRRIAIVSTHPIQYFSPLFRQLAVHDGWKLNVLYCHQATAEEQSAAGFGSSFEWDIPLLDGYPYRFLNNVARRPSVASYAGLDTPELADLIHDRRFDAVVVHGWHYKSAWQAIRACWKAGVPVLVRSDSHLRTERHLMKRVSKWPFYRWFIPRLDACLPVGQWSRDYFFHYGAEPARVFVVPHCVDTARFSRQAVSLAAQRRDLRERWRLNSGSAVWLFAGKFIEKKRPLDFVKAIVRAQQSGASLQGLMVGDGPLRPLCESYAAANQGNIRFAGFLNQSEIAQAYVAADALALPSDGGETWGLVVNEAMVCGRPCWVSDRVGCGPDLIEEGRTGGVFRLGDVESFAAALRQYSAPEMLTRMGELALRRIQQYSAESAAERLIEALEQTVRRTRGSSHTGADAADVESVCTRCAAAG
jgi:glycosyltransferase involved in cell wall biosynthesis